MFLERVLRSAGVERSRVSINGGEINSMITILQIGHNGYNAEQRIAGYRGKATCI